MIATLLNSDYTVAEELVAEPVCGEDFCDGCGDCLYCYSDDPCPRGIHTWYVYEDQVAEWREKHPDTKPWSWEVVPWFCISMTW